MTRPRCCATSWCLWNTGYFDDLRLEVEDGERGKIVRFVVVERRVVRTIEYEGNKSATISDILDRFKERRVGLSVESRYDPTTVQRAVVVLKELLGERGRQYAEVTPEVRQIPPSSVAVNFKIEEGPKVKVGDISFEGNKVTVGPPGPQQHEVPQADRHPQELSSSRACSPRPSTRRSWKPTRRSSATPIRKKAISGRRSRTTI